MPYDFASIEPKWQKEWADSKIFEVEADPSKEKFYCLEMFPYPSGALHMGHLRNYTIGDLMARFQRMNGKNVLYPMGFDSFGMPAENAAIKHKTAPSDWTWSNIEHMTQQLKHAGYSYDWRRRVETCSERYYRWNQWLFLQFYKKGLVYRKHAPVNWCEKCQTVLANEQVVGDGVCWRCGTPVTKRGLDQWFIRITDYAQELVDCLDELTGWPERVVTMQRNWIGRSEGVHFEMEIADTELKLEAFTTRIDTIFGVTFVAMAAEHPYVEEFAKRLGGKKAEELLDFAKRMSNRSAIERTAVGTDKQGMDTGFSAINPITGERVPIWIADYILTDYGTGAIMGVPAHDQRDFDFARKYNIPVITVVRPFSEELLKNAVLREKNRGGQIFFVHNRISDIEERAVMLKRLFPKLKITVAHSKTPEAALEKIMSEFAAGVTDILVCTTIVESGLDIPAANTLIVDDAQELGLAQMYQLRGRVGRREDQAYAFLFYPNDVHISVESSERLEAIAELDELGAGYQLAQRDLQIRGGGDLVGISQHGNSTKIGYQRYCDLLAEEIAKIKGTYRPQIELEVGFPVSIPASYLPQENLRVTLYRRMLKAESDGEVRALREETADRFGKLPPEVEFLFDAAAVRNAAYRYGITKVLAGRYELIVFCTPDENWEKLALPQRWRKRADGLIGPGGFAGMREMAQMLCRRDAAAQ